MGYTAVLDGRTHATTTGHPVEVWSEDGRLVETVYGEPSLPLWDRVSGGDESP